MSIASFEFVCFLAAAAGLYRICPVRARPAFLLGTSYLFYITWSPAAAALMAAVTILTYATGLAVERVGPRRSGLAIGAVVLLTGYLMAFKVALLTRSYGIAGLVMPLGISYYSFKLIAYVLNVHWGKMKASHSLVEFAAYVAFFPQIVAGPIERPEDFFAQLPPVSAPVTGPVLRIAWGLFKKLLVADNLSSVVNYVFSHTMDLHGASLWMGAYLFPLQLYADFSGLTDIAIGTGRLFGITGPENFNRPFTASNISEFWRRWHMSLTSWLGDFVFMPLRMALRNWGKLGLAGALTINMVAIGLWHGLTVTFLVFGLLHSVYLVADVLSARSRGRFFKQHPRWDRPSVAAGTILTFHMVAVSLVFFRAAYLGDAFRIFSKLFSGFPDWAMAENMLASTGTRALALGLCGYAVVEIAERLRPDLTIKRLHATAPRWGRWALCASAAVLLLTGLSLLLEQTGAGQAPFIYEIF